MTVFEWISAQTLQVSHLLVLGREHEWKGYVLLSRNWFPLAGSPQLVQLIDAVSKKGCYLLGDLQGDPKYCRKCFDEVPEGLEGCNEM